MKNCIEKKQSIIKETIDFPKCSIEFELRGATKKEYDKYNFAVSNLLTPELANLQLMAKVATSDEEYEEFAKTHLERYQFLVSEFNKKETEITYKLVSDCITTNHLYGGGFSVIKGELNITEPLKIIELLDEEDFNKLAKIATKLSTLDVGTNKEREAAVEEVKPVSETQK